jgi:hypothetical protein
MRSSAVLVILWALSAAPPGRAQEEGPGDAMLRAFFSREVAAIRSAADERLARASAASWPELREDLRRELLEMLGLDPLPPRTRLDDVVTGIVDRPDLGLVVERLHFQSLPGLYVTANLYRPRSFQGRLPAVLYLCGHGQVKIDGVAYGRSRDRHPAARRDRGPPSRHVPGARLVVGRARLQPGRSRGLELDPRP